MGFRVGPFSFRCPRELSASAIIEEEKEQPPHNPHHEKKKLIKQANGTALALPY